MKVAIDYSGLTLNTEIDHAILMVSC